uniref:Putative secreted protein n=1 Tax=Anopheles darlingi TaxID=43151 RepID=A0A2M4D706_ANODA
MYVQRLQPVRFLLQCLLLQYQVLQLDVRLTNADDGFRSPAGLHRLETFLALAPLHKWDGLGSLLVIHQLNQHPPHFWQLVSNLFR